MSSPSVLVVALLGAVAGALAVRPGHRLAVPYGEPPRGACGACAAPLPAGARGWWGVACRRCRTRLGAPWWLTATVGAAAGGVVGWALAPVGTGPTLVVSLLVLGAGTVMVVVGLLLAVIDLAAHRLPDPIVARLAVAELGLLIAAAATGAGWAPLERAVLGGLVMAGAYLVLALLPGANLGLGDVKLSAVLGLSLGWFGWPTLLLGAVLPHLLNGPVALSLLLRGKASRHTELPLGPALLAGWLLAVAAHAWADLPAG
ncbi:A24 family peptidase [Pilimelia columellifera]